MNFPDYHDASSSPRLPVPASPSLPLTCGIALGSNVGDRLANLRQACAAVSQIHCEKSSLVLSPVYKTEPVDCEPGTTPYFNAVMEIKFAGSPLELLDALQQIECALGRPSQRVRNAPRTIDLDLLYAGNLTVATGALALPHPRLSSRRFVLQPLADIRPELVLPGGRASVADLLAKLPPTPAVIPIHSSLDESPTAEFNQSHD
ncbi:MAG: 2-amino-4-hydroxy-6-hydroxymethyldihydropteridine diphosphokinase [Verrucomicrobiota bacterium]